MLSNVTLAFGKGQYGVDQTVASQGSYTVKSSHVNIKPNSDKKGEEKRGKEKTIYILDSVCTYVPGANAFISCDWNRYIRDKESFSKKSGITNLTVDVYGLKGTRTRKFIFREVEERIAPLIKIFLNKTPKLAKIKDKIIEAADLTLNFENRAVRTYKYPIIFYYLPKGTHLTVCLSNDRTLEILAIAKTNLFIYPAHPQIDNDKFEAVVKAIKSTFSEGINIVSISEHPLEIEEPPTIQKIINKILS